uniref:Uncharacterized protein n=1 Tax=Leersia perrieri TaxID=77586 RepID=A0A0D9XCV6_9ORYZ
MRARQHPSASAFPTSAAPISSSLHFWARNLEWRSWGCAAGEGKVEVGGGEWRIMAGTAGAGSRGGGGGGNSRGKGMAGATGVAILQAQLACSSPVSHHHQQWPESGSISALLRQDMAATARSRGLLAAGFVGKEGAIAGSGGGGMHC